MRCTRTPLTHRPIPDTVSAMVTELVTAIRGACPHGPYRLGGHCDASARNVRFRPLSRLTRGLAWVGRLDDRAEAALFLAVRDRAISLAWRFAEWRRRRARASRHRRGVPGAARISTWPPDRAPGPSPSGWSGFARSCAGTSLGGMRAPCRSSCPPAGRRRGGISGGCGSRHACPCTRFPARILRRSPSTAPRSPSACAHAWRGRGRGDTAERPVIAGDAVGWITGALSFQEHTEHTESREPGTRGRRSWRGAARRPPRGEETCRTLTCCCMLMRAR